MTNYINFISEDKATYSFEKIENCFDVIKKFNWNIPNKKVEFFAVAMELKKLYNFLYEKTNCCLFLPDDYNTEFTTFFNASYDYENWTIKELKNLLLINKHYICNQIKSIYAMMCNKEVNTIF